MIDAWLKQLAAARTAKALVLKPATAEDVAAAANVAQQYAAFLRSHGELRAFPSGRAHRLQIRAQPKSHARDGEVLLEFGNDDGAPVYFRSGDDRVYAIFDGDLEEVAGGFDEWLAGAFQRIRDSYDEDEWREFLDGAPPFTEEEKAIVEARRHYEVRLDGVDPDKKLRLRIRNGSDRTLPWLTVGVRGSDPEFLGALWIDVSKLEPGSTGTFSVDAYRSMTDPRNLKLRDLPDPTTSERASFRELTHRR